MVTSPSVTKCSDVRMRRWRNLEVKLEGDLLCP